MICCRVFFYIALDNLCSREVSIVILYPTWSHVEHVDMLTVCQLPQGAYNRDLQCGVLRACLADQPNQDWFTLRCKSAVMRLNGSNSNFRVSSEPFYTSRVMFQGHSPFRVYLQG